MATEVSVMGHDLPISRDLVNVHLVTCLTLTWSRDFSIDQDTYGICNVFRIISALHGNWPKTMCRTRAVREKQDHIANCLKMCETFGALQEITLLLCKHIIEPTNTFYRKQYLLCYL